MAIYLGDSGLIELKRDGLNTSLYSDLDPGDVNVERRRFSFDFDINALITGDRVEIATVDKSILELVKDHDEPDGMWYVHVDQAGGIRLYSSFADAINGDEEQALELVEPSDTKRIVARTRDKQYRCLAQVRSYEVTTSRDTVDVSTLGEEFRTSYANGMISGQGSLNCFWDYKPALCGISSDSELPNYLARLVIRTQQGASFEGRFFLRRPGCEDDTESLWYEAQCIVTNVATTFTATDVVTSQIQFVTTGPIRMKMGQVPGYLLQEDDDLLLQEDEDPIDLEI